MLEKVINDIAFCAGMGIGLGAGAGFTVIIIDYVFTSIMSLMKGR